MLYVFQKLFKAFSFASRRNSLLVIVLIMFELTEILGQNCIRNYSGRGIDFLSSRFMSPYFNKNKIESLQRYVSLTSKWYVVSNNNLFDSSLRSLIIGVPMKNSCSRWYQINKHNLSFVLNKLIDRPIPCAYF